MYVGGFYAHIFLSCATAVPRHLLLEVVEHMTDIFVGFKFAFEPS
jgi:hypothetical protein